MEHLKDGFKEQVRLDFEKQFGRPPDGELEPVEKAWLSGYSAAYLAAMRKVGDQI